MRVAVFGAGISGLTFVAALRRAVPEAQIEVFERDAAPDSRPQGYSLGLKRELGIPVLRRLGLFEQLRPSLTPVTNFVFVDQRGRHLLELPNSGNDNKHLTLRVRRDRLKAALRSAAPDVTIHYGAECVGYRHVGERIEVQLRSGEAVQADYVVAADGVGSALRQQVIGDPKRYLGLSAIVGEAPIAVEHPLLSGGYFMTLGDSGSSVFCYREAEGVHLSFTQHAASEASLAAETPAVLLRRIQEATAAWHEPIPTITAMLDPTTIVVRGYYDREPTRHVRDGRLWLIGDAAHPMCPFQGQGANIAMLDALELADALEAADANGMPPAQAKRLEAKIVARGRKAVLESRNAAKRFHTTSRFQQANRTVGFQMANFFIKRFTKSSGS